MREKTNYVVKQATILFKQNGLHSVSMEDIALGYGISKKILYVNFQSKEMIVKTIVQKLISKTSIYMRLCPEISPNAVKELENFSGHILSVLEILTPKIIRDLKKYYPEVYTQLIVFKNNELMPYLAYCLNRGISEDIFRPNINKWTTSWLYCWQIQNVLEGDIPYEDANRIMENVNDLFLHGILNPKGLKMYWVDKQEETNVRKKSNE